MGLFQSKSVEEQQREARLEQARENYRIEQILREELLLRRQEEFSRQLELRRQQELRRQRELRRQAEVSRLFSNLHLGGRSLNAQSPAVKVEKNPQLIRSLLQCVGKNDWSDKMTDGRSAFILESLDCFSQEFMEQKSRFRRTNKNTYRITDIREVINPYLFLQFKLKEKQYRKKNYGVLETKKLYHGTKQQYADAICTDNFDWRLHGTGTGHRFGQGVSFSPFANYATHYGDKKSFDKVMFAVDVLVGRCIEGNGNTVIPDEGADTTVNAKGSVYVKYDDNEFYPAYLIHYQGFEIKNR